MNHWKNQYVLKILIGLFVLFMVGCPNNLVDKIEEEVEVVVTPPSIVSIYPESGSVSIPVDMDDILITFSKHIDSSSVNSSTFITTDSDGNTVSGTYSVSNDTISFNPSSNLAYNTEFTITAKSAILDVDGNPMAEEFSWTFTTEDAPAGIKPIIKYVRINGGQSATNGTIVSLEISATDILGNTQGLRTHYRIVGNPDWTDWADLTADGLLSVTDIDLNVSENGSVVVFEVEVKDVAGVPSYITQSEIVFESTPPSIIDVNWDDESVFPYNGSILRITFDDEMDYSSFTEITYFVERVSDSALIPGVINLVEANSTYNSAVNLSGLSLEPNIQYQVTLSTDVTDIAGNVMGGETSPIIWLFDTGDSTDTTAPDGSITLTPFDDDAGGPNVTSFIAPYANGVIATNRNYILIDLSGIDDDYNEVVGMKFWGDTDGGYTFEPANWSSFNSSQIWYITNSPGTKFVLYKFLDSAGNESETVGQVKIFLDGVNPITPTIEVNGDAEGIDTYTNNTERNVSIDITASDTDTGIEKMMISTSPIFTGAEWVDWVSSVDEWELPVGDDAYTVYVKVMDYLENESSASIGKSVILDRIDPIVSFSHNNILVSAEVQLEDSGVYYAWIDTNGISNFFWEKVSGPGSIYFNNDTGDGSTNDGFNSAEPYVIGTTEGVYYIKLTVTDPVGNSSYDIVPLTWDETPPVDITSLTVTETAYINPNSYTTTGQPTWTWNAVTGADSYKVSFDSFSTSIDVGSTSYAPNTVLSDGSYTLSVRAYDNAGNYSNASTPISKTVIIDTIAPVINITNYNYIANIAQSNPTIDFSNILNDGLISGADNIQWAKTTGPGSLTFGSENANVTTVSATADGTYQMSITASDNAGNESIAYLSILRDVTKPGTPSVSGPVLTPSIRPTWIWSSGGGGNGTYQWDLNSAGWSGDTTVTSYMPGSGLDGTPPGVNHVLSVREKDVAGNWSDIGSWTIEIDTDAKTPPSIAIDDIYPSLRIKDYITWNAVSGLGGIPEATRYQYRINGGSWIIVEAPLSADPGNPSLIPQFTGLSDGSHILEIQEWMSDVSEWLTDKTGSHSIIVDTVLPYAPTLTGEGLDTIHSDRTATKDNYPTWSWYSGGNGGNGQFEYRLYNGSTWSTWTSTTNTSYTPYISSDVTCELEVKERDDAGNWSSVDSHRITVDTTTPSLTSIELRDQSPYSEDTDFSHTNSSTVYARIVGSESETYAVKIQYWNSVAGEWTDTGYTFSGTTTVASPRIITRSLATGDGSKTDYIRLIDEAGNYTSYKSDSIILDTVAPTGTLYVNNNATYTPSLSYILNFNITDNLTQVSNLKVTTRDYYNSAGGGNTVWSAPRSYSAIMTSDYQFSKNAGGKYAYTYIYDEAGNSLYKYDYIYLQVPEPQYAYKGYYTTGYSNIYYSPVTEDSGAYITRYYVYSTDDPNADPNNGDSVTYESYTTSTTYKQAYIPKGEVLYFFTRAYNADTGGYGPYSATNVMGFSSNVTVVYDKSDSTDAAKALYIKQLLENTYFSSGILAETNMAGTMPTYTVTLLDEDLINNTSYSTNNKIYGDPIIVTPGTAFTRSVTTYDVRARHIAAGGRGLIGMGSNGLSILDRIEDNWGAWGLSGTAPSQIGSGESGGLGTSRSSKSRAASASESIWHSPMQNTYFTSNFSESYITLNLFSYDVYRYGAYLGSTPSVTDGYVYAGDPNFTTYYPVVRQGRFLQYGYVDIPGRDYTGAMTYQYGQTFFINLIARMDNF